MPSLIAILATLIIHLIYAHASSLDKECDCGYSADATINPTAVGIGAGVSSIGDPMQPQVWTNMWYQDFRNGAAAAAGLDINDIFVASYNISAKVSGAHSRRFGTQNVFYNTVSEDGGLVLAVTVENGTLMQCGGFGTRRQDILYGSFRSYIKTTPISGTVGAMYIFNPGQEIDIELLSAVKPPQAYFAIHPGLLENGRASHLTHTNYHLGFDPTLDFHEYRFDWMPGITIFYIDGIEVQRLVTNIPTLPSRFMFNHWSDGNPNFSKGPPVENAYMEIMNITAFFNHSVVDPVTGINTTGSPKCQTRQSPCSISGAMAYLKTLVNTTTSQAPGPTTEILQLTDIPLPTNGLPPSDAAAGASTTASAAAGGGPHVHLQILSMAAMVAVAHFTCRALIA